MKTTITFLALLLALFAAGCKDNPVEQYGTGLTDSYKRAGQTADAATLSALRTAVGAFRTANGRNPQDLAELAAFAGVKIEAGKYNYDPATGEITPR